jgi:CPA2 family monovalent cation:H+ antiporter-2
MLLDPLTLLRAPLQVVAVVLIIVLAKPAIAAVTALVLGQSPGTAFTIGAGLGQIGEFSFILGTLGRSLGLLSNEAYQLIIAGAIISIALNPVLFRASETIGRAWRPAPDLAPLEAAPLLAPDLTAEGVPRGVGKRQEEAETGRNESAGEMAR